MYTYKTDLYEIYLDEKMYMVAHMCTGNSWSLQLKRFMFFCIACGPLYLLYSIIISDRCCIMALCVLKCLRTVVLICFLQYESKSNTF